MNRIWKLALGLTALALLGGVAVRAYAQGHHGRDFARHHIDQTINTALDAAKVTSQQRAAIEAARDHVHSVMAEEHQANAGQMDEALNLFTADQLDATAIAQHRARHEAAAKKVGDAIVQAIYDAHDALTPIQRQEVVASLKAQHQSHAGKGAWRQQMVRSMIDERVDSALEQIKATPEQRAKIATVKDRLFDAFTAAHGDPSADIDRALALFQQDKIDPAAVQALRDAHQARLSALGQAVQQAVSDVHDTLTKAQRQQLADWVRAHHAGHGPHHG
jgi:Spy/CpxP family protein refolding chaperone